MGVLKSAWELSSDFDFGCRVSQGAFGDDLMVWIALKAADTRCGIPAGPRERSLLT